MPEIPLSAPKTFREQLLAWAGGAFGQGFVLVVLPFLGLWFGFDKISGTPTLGLPILAILGIMVLFGAMSLAASLFHTLQLSDPRQALGLPEGSIRAAIALSLIVLFAIISILLYLTLSQSTVLAGVREAERAALLQTLGAQVVAVEPKCERTPGVFTRPEGCETGQLRYDVHLRKQPASEATDIAKQLLILVGTLMTSVTSFYFGSRTSDATRDKEEAQLPRPPEQGAIAPGDGEDAIDGCDVAVETPTPDADLPPARGGVAPT